MYKLLITLILLGSMNAFAQESTKTNPKDSILYARLKQLDLQSDSIQNRLKEIENELETINTQDDSLISIINSKPKITSFEAYKFEKWLSSHGFISTQFKDTVIQKTFELWTTIDYSKIPDTCNRIASTDFNYSLITNFDKSLKASNTSLYFNFLNNRSKKAYSGFIALKERSFDVLDYFWYDDKTIFFLFRHKHGSFELRKLQMKVNEICIYRTI